MERLFPNDKILVTEFFDIHQDWDTPIPGFFIIASRKNKESFSEFDNKESLEFIYLLVELRQKMKKILGIEKIILFQNENTKHKTFHICLFPFHEWMEMFGKFNIDAVERIVKYSKKEMTNQENIQKVKDYVNKMQNQISPVN